MAVYLRVHLKRLAVRRAALIRVTNLLLAAIGERRSELSIELVGDRRMRHLNRLYRKKDRATDVLAFPMREAHMLRTARRTSEMLGDVVISVPTAIRQAREAGRSPDQELVSLLVHGVLHLCGYDHERNEKKAARMHRREQAILKMICPVPRLVIDRAAMKRSR